MNRGNDTRIGMYKAVQLTLANHATTITDSGVTVIATYKVHLTSRIGELETISQETAVSTKGITLTKQEARKVVITTAYTVAGGLYAYAVDTNDIALESDMRTRSLDALKDEELVAVVKRIHTKASQIAATVPNPLEDYAVTTDILDSFSELIESYNEKTVAPRSAIVQRTRSNKQLIEKFKQTDRTLSKLDKIIFGQKDSYPTFYTDYKNARILIGPMRLRTQITGTVLKVTDLEIGTTAIVPNAQLVITAQPYTTIRDGHRILVQPGPWQLKTDVEGKFAQATPDTNTLYTVKCTLPGYEVVLQNEVFVKIGKKTSVDFKLIPIQ